MKKTISFGIAASIAAGCFAALPSSANSSIKGDMNGDSVVGYGDVRALRSYILGDADLSAEQYSNADIDGDGVVDAFDLALVRSNIVEHSGQIPDGTWIATGSKGTRFYNFKKGTAVDESDGKTTSFKCEASETNFNFDKAVCGDASHALFSWTSDKSFALRWDKGYVEELTYFSADQVDTSRFLRGRYVTSGNGAQRTFKFNGLSGSIATGADAGKTFRFRTEGNKYIFTLSDGRVKTAIYSKIDSMHFSLKWDYGVTERFTSQNFETKNGITYINGILVANKTYSLPSTYNPGGLTSETLAAFNRMKADAYSQAGLSLSICSGYRSYSYQRDLYNGYVAARGQAAADAFSARPGHSEHQTGLAIDVNNASSSFDNSPEAKWLAANAYKYGFIIRYPQGKQDITGYKYESWHVRYLGETVAKEVYDSGLTLEEFLCVNSYYH